MFQVKQQPTTPTTRYALYGMIYNLLSSGSSSAKRALYGSMSWICYPLLEDGFDFLSTDVTIKASHQQGVQEPCCHRSKWR